MVSSIDVDHEKLKRVKGTREFQKRSRNCKNRTEQNRTEQERGSKSCYCIRAPDQDMAPAWQRQFRTGEGRDFQVLFGNA